MNKFRFVQTVVVATLLIQGVGFERPAFAQTENNKDGQKTRIVSLAPSNTELIYSLGAQDKLVGISSYCSYPPETKSKPKVGSFVSINWERLARLKPDVVLLVQGQESLSFQLKKHNVKSIVLNNKSLDDISKNLVEIGKICGRSEKAAKLADGFKTNIAGLSETVKNEPKRKVFFCVWPKPIVTVGGDSFLNDVITACGGTNIAAHAKSGYPKYSPEKLIASQPDLLVMPYESRNTNFSTTPPWSLLSATKKKNVYHLPDREHDFLSRPTLRIYGGLYDLARQLHPAKVSSLKTWYANCQRGLSVAAKN
jgi:iron complex transport system substrate-binding protein